MDNVSLDKASRYLDFLPAIYQESKQSNGFTGKYLKIFEKILTGINDDLGTRLPAPGGRAGFDISRAPLQASADTHPGIEQIIDVISEFFDPGLVPGEFLDWLAGWTALVLREDWTETARRKLLKKIIPLYRKRGTKEGLTEYLKIFVGDNIELDEDIQGIIVGTPSGTPGVGTIGRDTFVGGLLPHFFIVTISFAVIASLGFIQDTVTATKDVLNLEKPAHTYYALRFSVPGIYVWKESTPDKYTRVGINTLIGRTYPFFV